MKLTEHVLQVMKRIIEDIIWDVVNVDDIQFGFMSGLGTTNAIFILKQIQEKYIGRIIIFTLHLLT